MHTQLKVNKKYTCVFRTTLIHSNNLVLPMQAPIPFRASFQPSSSILGPRCLTLQLPVSTWPQLCSHGSLSLSLSPWSATFLSPSTSPSGEATSDGRLVYTRAGQTLVTVHDCSARSCFWFAAHNVMFCSALDDMLINSQLVTVSAAAAVVICALHVCIVSPVYHMLHCKQLG